MRDEIAIQVISADGIQTVAGGALQISNRRPCRLKAGSLAAAEMTESSFVEFRPCKWEEQQNLFCN